MPNEVINFEVKMSLRLSQLMRTQKSKKVVCISRICGILRVWEYNSETS